MASAAILPHFVTCDPRVRVDHVITSEVFTHIAPSGTYKQTVTLHGQYDANNGAYCGTMAGGDNINIPSGGVGGTLTAYVQKCGDGTTWTTKAITVSGTGDHYIQTDWISAPLQGYTQGEYNSNAGDWIDKFDFCYNGKAYLRWHVVAEGYGESTRNLGHLMTSSA